MFHLHPFALMQCMWLSFKPFSLIVSVPLCQEYKSVLRCTEVAEVCLETCGNKEIHLLGTGRETGVRLDTLFAAAA